MGSNTWRTWSVLALMSAALVGCNTTPTRDRPLVGGPKVGESPFASNQNKDPFPQAGGPQKGQPNTNPWGPGPGGNLTGAGGNNNSFTPQGNFNAPKDNSAPRPEIPVGISNVGGPGNASPQPYPAQPGVTPPPRTDVFGGARPDANNVPGGPVIPSPAGFNPR